LGNSHEKIFSINRQLAIPSFLSATYFTHLQIGKSIMKKILLAFIIGISIFLIAPKALLAQITVNTGNSSQKICSVFVPNNWRDTVTVPTLGWNTTQCDSFRREVGAELFQLGCFQQFGFSFGIPMTGVRALPQNFPPNNSCNWQND
jgi:hypothetical protein